MATYQICPTHQVLPLSSLFEDIAHIAMQRLTAKPLFPHHCLQTSNRRTPRYLSMIAGEYSGKSL